MIYIWHMYKVHHGLYSEGGREGWLILRGREGGLAYTQVLIIRDVIFAGTHNRKRVMGS